MIDKKDIMGFDRVVYMRKPLLLLIIIFMLVSLCGCSSQEQIQLAATTLPVYEFTSRICDGTGISVGQLVTESVSCLHDYSLQVSQLRMIEGADAVVMSGGGLEDFLDDALHTQTVVDASEGMTLICPEDAHNLHDAHNGHEHHHESDPHYWLSPIYAKDMAENICAGLCSLYPQYQGTFRENTAELISELEDLQSYGEQELSQLACRELITFHDGFTYFAESFSLTIIKAIEEESGQEASAAELKELIGLVRGYQLPAVFTETNGSTSAAEVISAETGCSIYRLDMAISGGNYFSSMYHNIDTIKEALG